MVIPRFNPHFDTLETRDVPSAASLGNLVGAVRDGHNWFLAGNHSDSMAAQVRQLGLPGDRYLAGDWNGDGKADLVAVRGNAEGGLTWHVDLNGDGGTDVEHKYGLVGDTPFLGDWDGNGSVTPGVARVNRATGGLDWYLDNTRTPYANPTPRQFGLASGDTPVVGDWDGNGRTDVGVVRPDVAVGLLQWNLDTSGDIWPEVVRDYGLLSTHDTPITGDWNSDGKTDLGVTRNDYFSGLKGWYLDTSGDKFADIVQTFGFVNDTPVVGGWTSVTIPPVQPPPPSVSTPPPAISTSDPVGVNPTPFVARRPAIIHHRGPWLNVTDVGGRPGESVTLKADIKKTSVADRRDKWVWFYVNGKPFKSQKTEDGGHATVEFQIPRNARRGNTWKFTAHADTLGGLWSEEAVIGVRR